MAARESTRFDEPAHPSIDEADRASCRPDFVVLVYPAYLEKEGQLSRDLDMKAKIPPTLIIHSEDDETFVPGSNLYHAALEEAGAAHEFKLYATGGHGYGLRCKLEAKDWPDFALEWLRKVGVR